MKQSVTERFNMKNFQAQDVVKVIDGPSKGKTGVVIQSHRAVEGMVCVVPKGNDFGIWYFEQYLKRIGSTKRNKK